VRSRSTSGLYAIALGVGLPPAVFAYVAATIVETGRVAGDRAGARLATWVVARVELPLDAGRLLDYANVGGAIVLTLPALLLLVRGDIVRAGFWSTAMGGVLLLDPLLKTTFKRPGPDGAYSFPSGTALFAAAAILAAALLLRSTRLRFAVIAVGAAVAIAICAVIVAAAWHYPSDVVAGWAIGIAWSTTLWLAFARWTRRPQPRLCRRCRGAPFAAVRHRGLTRSS